MDDKVLKFAEIYESEALRRTKASAKDAQLEVQVSRGVDDSGRGARAVHTGGTCQTKS